MICGAQFRHELIEILHLSKFFPRQQQHQQQYRLKNQQKGKRPKKGQPTRVILSLPSSSSSQNGTKAKNVLPHNPSIDSFLVSFHNKDDISMTEIEQPSDEASQCHIKSTYV